MTIRCPDCLLALERALWLAPPHVRPRQLRPSPAMILHALVSLARKGGRVWGRSAGGRSANAPLGPPPPLKAGWWVVDARLAVRVPPNTHPLHFATAHQGPMQGVPFFSSQWLGPYARVSARVRKGCAGAETPERRSAADQPVDGRAARPRLGRRGGYGEEVSARLRHSRGEGVPELLAPAAPPAVWDEWYFFVGVCTSRWPPVRPFPPPAAHRLPSIVRCFLWKGPAGGSTPERHRPPSRLRCVRLCERGTEDRGGHTVDPRPPGPRSEARVPLAGCV